MRALASAILFFIINIIGLGTGPQVVGILNDLLESRFGSEAVRYSLFIAATASIVSVFLFCLAASKLIDDLKMMEEAIPLDRQSAAR